MMTKGAPEVLLRYISWRVPAWPRLFGEVMQQITTGVGPLPKYLSDLLLLTEAESYV